jgi:ubiquinone biosynthesis protein
MLKKRLIPTPLPALKPKAMSVQRLKRAPRFRLLFIFWLLMGCLWHLIVIRVRPAAARKGKHTPENFALRLRLAFERLGGMWIKTAQILAMRRDIFSPQICSELSKLHDHATGFPGEVAVKIIEEELGCPIDMVFSDFDTVPLAAASIGQVHVGRLRENGVKAAVKVQRPTIAESFRTDLKKDRSAKGTSASVGRAGRITRSNSRNRSGWIRTDCGGSEERPIHAQGQICLVSADRS